MSELSIEVQPREETGKGAAKKLRASGWIPAVVYGGGRDPVAIKVQKTSLLDLLRAADSENAVFLLELAGTGKQRHTMIREISSDPVSRRIKHVDFQRILMDEAVRVNVAIEIVGVPSGVKNQGGVLDFVTRELAIECLPGASPSSFELDVSELEIGDHLEASDIVLPEGVELLEELDRVLVSVGAPRVEEEEEEEDELLLETVAAEPEVIGRGKDDDEEDDQGEG